MHKNILMVAASVIVLAGASSSIRAEGGALDQARGMAAEGAVSLDRSYENSASLGGGKADPVSALGADTDVLPRLVKSKARLSSRIDGGIENSKIPDIPESAGAAIREYLEPQGAVLDFMLGFLGGLAGYVAGGLLAVGYLEESNLHKSPLGIRVLTVPLALVGVLTSAAVGIAVGSVLGVVKMGQAVGEAVQGKFDRPKEK